MKTIKADTVTMLPSPAEVSVNNSLTLTCTSTFSMRFVFIRDSRKPLADVDITLRNSGGTCWKQFVRPGYEISCDSVNGPYRITIKSVNQDRHNSQIKCTILYGDNPDDTSSAETTIKVNGMFHFKVDLIYLSQGFFSRVPSVQKLL